MLKVVALKAHYGLLQALFEVDMEVLPGDTVALIGANGAGKTTLLRCLAGAVHTLPTSIVLNNEAVGGASEQQQLQRGIALVPEGRRLFASLSVRENLQLAARNGRPGHWTVDRVLRHLSHLEGLLDRPSTALSGGQQQLVAIARALVCNPAYLLCDEISLGLSPMAVDQVYSLLREVKNAGMAVVVVEQNVKRALAESNRYVCLQKGRGMLKGISSQADSQAVAHAYFGI